MKYKTVKKIQGGFSLLELLLVVAVGAVLILAGLGAYRLVTANNDINTAQRQLNVVKQQTQNAFAGQNNYGAAGADITLAAINAGVFPQDMARLAADAAGTEIPDSRRGIFGRVEIFVGDNPRTFSVSFVDVPRPACSRLGVLFNPVTTTDFNFVEINDGGEITDTTTAIIAAECNADLNEMVFNFD